MALKSVEDLQRRPKLHLEGAVHTVNIGYWDRAVPESHNQTLERIGAHLMVLTKVYKVLLDCTCSS